jgi:hypothetical protein
MKKIILTVIAAAISYCIAYPQPCLPEGIEFYSQEQIDNFQTNYPGCTEIEGDVFIWDGSPNNLTNLLGLNVITSIGGSLYCGVYDAGNPGLTSLAGLEKLTSIGGSLNILKNNALINLSGLDGLTSIGGNAWIWDNYLLNNLTGLENLTSIGGGISIWSNTHLTSLASLGSITSIGGYLEIGYNTYLTSLSGIDNIIANSIDSILIQNNANLSECDVKSICDYLATPSGKIEIHDNSFGCFNLEQVKYKCANAVEEIKSENGITIIPNPSKDKITISSPAIYGNTQLSIFNVSGEKVIERQLTDTETQIDISALPRGMYFVKVRSEKVANVGKFIKE